MKLVLVVIAAVITLALNPGAATAASLHGMLPQRQAADPPGAFQVLLTGFGPFMNYTTNPSQLVAEALHDQCAQFRADNVVKHDYAVCFRTMVLPVADNGSVAVASYLSKFTEATADRIPYDVIIHMGLEDAAKGLLFETIGFNQRANASTPGPIQPGGPTLLPTTVNLGHVRIPELYSLAERRLGRPLATDAALKVNPTRFSANDTTEAWSRDAGTFYCNETLYRTLYQLRSRNLCRSPAFALIPAMFVHLPELTVMSTDAASSLITELAGKLALPLAQGVCSVVA
ncbi:hypothetical protein CAOG_04325 [Capsaspora owczarzaki ATCC 30864]|uniref:Pyrrolidone-carboxylate peptidase n=1 Tax=Capsaspora owczarzaki (strain ATCC 30864) TaxID=595528 RepID=A0A0D2UEL8_CAPO3|nr:hypothetical protein CAOG_04325 [Capsaspora owczarzaki ATCC 30864]KJE93556.1 hypothetical protein CAOG_004325 [Capsaspora owczarzaki ATCC 30864]|eukprot:XP_004348153.1 hypothetical protein CAOG_04325 [Capsaspora owczarzaki ATCC 30864]